MINFEIIPKELCDSLSKDINLVARCAIDSVDPPLRLRSAFEIAAEWILKASFFPLQAADALPDHGAVSDNLESYIQKILPKKLSTYSV